MDGYSSSKKTLNGLSKAKLSHIDSTKMVLTNLTPYRYVYSDGKKQLISRSIQDSDIPSTLTRNSNNLSDLTNVSQARANISVYSTADVYTKNEGDNRYCLESNNLSDLVSASTARTNLDVYQTSVLYTITECDNKFCL